MNSFRFTITAFILVFSLYFSYSTSNVIGQEVNPPQALSGSHTILSCDMCHGEGVWHTAQKESTVCKRCHGDQWEILTEKSMHSALMIEGTYRSGSNEVVVSYCSTCHSPHNNDYLRIRNTNGTVKHVFFNNSIQICINCHFTGGADANIGPMSLPTENGGIESIAVSEYKGRIHQNSGTIEILSQSSNEPKVILLEKDIDIKPRNMPSILFSYLSLPLVLILGMIGFSVLLIIITTRNKRLV